MTRLAFAHTAIALVLAAAFTSSYAGPKPPAPVTMRPAAVPVRLAVHSGEGAEPGKELKLDCGNGVTMSLVLIPAGEFLMGSPEDEKNRSANEGPRHRVRITRAFWMGKYEVTQDQYEAVRDDLPPMYRKPSYFAGANNPVERVHWHDAAEFCKRLSAKTGMTVRLPTEAEWEYACRAGSDERFWWGESETEAGTYANVADRTAKADYPAWSIFDTDDGHVKTAPVGTYRPNGFGLYDMIGNVWEWCADWYAEDYYGSSPLSDPSGPANGEYRVLRGGGYGYGPRNCRSARRFGVDANGQGTGIGFRVAVSCAAE